MVAVKKQGGDTKPEGISALTKVVKKIKKSDAQKKAKQKSEDRKGIIMLNHIPHGFYEKELSEFFGQFGRVLRVKVARSKKTGKSKGFAYVQFQLEEVAKIAADSMDNYLMFERLVKCKLLGPEANPKKIFADSYVKEGYNPGLKKQEKLKANQETAKSVADQKVLLEARVLNLRRQNAKLSALGIDYQFTPPELPSVVQTDVSEPGTEETPASGIKIHGRKQRKPKKEGEKAKAKKKSKLTKVGSESPKVVKTIKKKPKAKKLGKKKEVVASAIVGTPASPSPKILQPKDSLKKVTNLPSLNEQQSTPPKGRSPKQSKAKSPQITPVVASQNLATTPSVPAKGLPSPGKNKKQSPKQRKSEEKSAKASPVAPKLNDGTESALSDHALVDSIINKISKTPSQVTASPLQSTSPKAKKLTPKERKSLKLLQKRAQQSLSPQPNKSPKGKKIVEPVQLPSSPVPPSPKVKSPQPKKRKSIENVELQAEKSPKTPKLSLTEVVATEPVINETQSIKKPNKKAGKKGDDFKTKMSPKLLRSKNRQSELIAPAEIPAETEVISLNKKKSPIGKKEKAKFSPKVLRSKGKKSENFTDALISSNVSEIQDVIESAIAKVTKPATKIKGNAAPSANVQKKQNSPKETKLPKFSPKVLRSRAARQSESTPIVSVNPAKTPRGRKSMK